MPRWTRLGLLLRRSGSWLRIPRRLPCHVRLTATLAVSENDERLTAQEEQIKKLRERQAALAKQLAVSLDEDHVRITVTAFVEVCMDGNKPLQSQQFGAMCRALQLSEAEIEWMRSERQKRRGSRFSGYVPGGLTRQLSWSSKG